MFERVFTFSLAPGAGPLTESADLHLPAVEEDLYIEAWISNFGGSNVHIIRDEGRTLTDTDSFLTGGLSDVLLTVTGAGVTKRRLPEDVNGITVLFEAANSSAQYQLVQVRVYSE